MCLFIYIYLYKIERKQQNQEHYLAKSQVRKVKNDLYRRHYNTEYTPADIEPVHHKPHFRASTHSAVHITLTGNRRKHQNPNYRKSQYYSQTKTASSPLDILFQNNKQSHGSFPLQKMVQLAERSLKTRRHNQHLSKFADKLKFSNRCVHLNKC